MSWYQTFPLKITSARFREIACFSSATTDAALVDLWLQVLPQLLYFFHVKDGEDSLDWATIAVYTCEASCEGGASYKEEFAWVQLASQSISHQ